MKRQKVRFTVLFISFLLFPITIFYFSPFLPFMSAKLHIINGSVIVFLCLILGGMFLGRAFCGWIMPCGGIQEVCFSMNNRPVKQSRWDYLKFFIWAVWLGFLIFFVIKSGGYNKIDFFFGTKHGISIWAFYYYIVYYSVIFLFFISALIFGKRSVCHYSCWITPFMILGRKMANIIKIPSLRLKKVNDNCTQCKLCDKVCPMSLEVSAMVHSGKMENTECILCGSCIDVCKTKTIKFAFTSYR